MSREVDHRPDLRLAAGLAAVALISTAVPVLWMWSVRDRLPEPVARHWGASGVADGFSTLTTMLWVGVLVPLLVALPLAAFAVLARQPLLLRRILAATAGFLVVFVNVLQLGAVSGQLDLADAADAPAPDLALGVGTVLGLVIGVAVAALARETRLGVPATAPPPADAPRPTGQVEPGRWEARSTTDQGATFVAGSVLVLLTVMAAVLTWWLAILGILACGVCVALTRFRVVVDAEGLTVLMLGRRALHVPVAEVARADVTDIDAFWEFGGWGLRVDGRGRTGVISSAGEALRVRRGDGSEVIVTIDDAGSAAALLNAAADAHHDERPGSTGS